MTIFIGYFTSKVDKKCHMGGEASKKSGKVSRII
jgi:hypothetical protein